MAYLLVKHTVKDFNAWKPIFDQQASTRTAGGSKGGHVFRDADAPNEVIVLLNWSSVADARKFANSDDLRATMERAGVQGRPEVHFLDEQAHPRA